MMPDSILIKKGALRAIRIKYAPWFEKDKWTDKEAVFLLCDITRLDKNKYEWVSRGDYEYFVAKSNNFEVEEEIINEILGIQEWMPNHPPKRQKPLEWIQWFVNEGILFLDEVSTYWNERYPPRTALPWYILDSGIKVSPSDNSTIHQYYKEFATEETWSFEEAIGLYQGKPMGYTHNLMKCAFFTRYGRESDYIIVRQLKDTILTKSISFVEIDRHSHIERRFKPREIVEWAKSRGYKYPILLMEALGYATPANESTEQNKVTRGCKKEILQEFSKRRREKKLSATWEEEIKFLQGFALNHHDEEYTIEGLKNILTKTNFLKAKQQSQ